MTSKTQGILSYLGILWLIPYFGGKDSRDDFSRYHLKQGFGLIVSAIVFSLILKIGGLIIPFVFGILSYLNILFLIFSILGIINVLNGKKQPLPFIGKYFEDKLDFID